MSDTPRTDDVVMQAVAQGMRLAPVAEFCRELERENAALREAKDAYFNHNNILVELMTEDQKQKALEILMSRPKEAQP